MHRKGLFFFLVFIWVDLLVHVFNLNNPMPADTLLFLESLLDFLIQTGCHVVLVGDIFNFYCSMFHASCDCDSQIASDDRFQKFKGFVAFLQQRLGTLEDAGNYQGGRIYFLLGNHEGNILKEVNSPLRPDRSKPVHAYEALRFDVPPRCVVHCEHGDRKVESPAWDNCLFQLPE